MESGTPHGTQKHIGQDFLVQILVHLMLLNVWLSVSLLRNPLATDLLASFSKWSQIFSCHLRSDPPTASPLNIKVLKMNRNKWAKTKEPAGYSGWRAASPRSFPLLILNRNCFWRTKMASSGSWVHLQSTGEAVVTWGSIRFRCKEDQSCPMNVNRIREVLTNWISGSGFPHGWHPNMDDGSTKNININNGSRN